MNIYRYAVAMGALTSGCAGVDATSVARLTMTGAAAAADTYESISRPRKADIVASMIPPEPKIRCAANSPGRQSLKRFWCTQETHQWWSDVFEQSTMSEAALIAARKQRQYVPATPAEPTRCVPTHPQAWLIWGYPYTCLQGGHMWYSMRDESQDGFYFAEREYIRVMPREGGPGYVSVEPGAPPLSGQKAPGFQPPENAEELLAPDEPPPPGIRPGMKIRCVELPGAVQAREKRRFSCWQQSSRHYWLTSINEMTEGIRGELREFVRLQQCSGWGCQ